MVPTLNRTLGRTLATRRRRQTTPMMEQYTVLKSEVPGHILFFQMGDFYELFFDDAATASAELDITLTSRGTHNAAPIPMAGVPARAAAFYIHRLVKRGHLVAIADQVEDPAAAKARGSAIVTRAITQKITPGTVLDSDLLAPKSANYLAAIIATPHAHHDNHYGIAWIELSTGEWFLTHSSSHQHLAADLARIHPAEILLPPSFPLSPDHPALAPYYVNPNPVPEPESSQSSAESSIPDSLSQPLDALNALTSNHPIHRAAGTTLLSALSSATSSASLLLQTPKIISSNQTMSMDPSTRASLELSSSSSAIISSSSSSSSSSSTTSSASRRNKAPSLLSLMDKTVTGPGSRKLASWLSSPLVSVEDINTRLDAVQSFYASPEITKKVRSTLRGTGDLSRSLQRICMSKGNPRDLGVLVRALSKAQSLSDLVTDTFDPQTLESLSPLQEQLESALSSSLPLSLSELSSPSSPSDGSSHPAIIADGYCAELDRARKARDAGSSLVAELESEYRKATGIASLKIKSNNVLGYFVQVPATRKGRMDEFAERSTTAESRVYHIQSMASSHRYASDELKDLERELAAAASEALLLETQLFNTLCDSALASAAHLFDLADALAHIDVYSGLARLALDHGFVRPSLDTSTSLAIKDGRHPLVELSPGNTTSFTPNDCVIDEKERVHIITGANMGGKSTYLRQNALIVILAQMGSFVPASSAQIGVVDAVFSRVGAADDLAGDRSTFMVEMVESAHILKNASPSSLVLMDEIGRGTSTYDGLALAWAIVESLAEETQARTLFATHYHELTDIATTIPVVANYALDIRALADTLMFLYKVVPGVASRSYGLHVARLAGIPEPIVARAQTILDSLHGAE